MWGGGGGGGDRGTEDLGGGFKDFILFHSIYLHCCWPRSMYVCMQRERNKLSKFLPYWPDTFPVVGVWPAPSKTGVFGL